MGTASVFIKNVSSSTSHKKTPSLPPYVCTRIYDPTLPLMLTKIMWAVLSPIHIKREGDGSLFCSLTRRKFLRFFKTSQSFDQITTFTYVLMDNFLSLFLVNSYYIIILHIFSIKDNDVYVLTYIYFYSWYDNRKKIELFLITCIGKKQTILSSPWKKY